MAAYVMVSYDITDPEGYEGYVPGVLPLLEKHGAEILVADYEAQPLEGTARSVYVVLRFPSEEAARNWHSDPAYQPVLKIRMADQAPSRGSAGVRFRTMAARGRTDPGSGASGLGGTEKPQVAQRKDRGRKLSSSLVWHGWCKACGGPARSP